MGKMPDGLADTVKLHPKYQLDIVLPLLRMGSLVESFPFSFFSSQH